MLNRIKRSLAQRGLAGTVHMCWVHLMPGAWLREAKRRRIDSEFDSRFAVDTGGTLRPERDEVVGNNWTLGNHYAAVDPGEFVAALNHLSIDHTEFTFIDMGSGKGRCLLLASELPFRKIIGVEFCPELNRAARKNIASYPAAARRGSEIEIFDSDATTFALPETPLILFLNNPFAAPLMAKVVKNVAASFERNPRRIIVIYFWPFHAHEWEQAKFLTRIRTSPAIFDSHPAEEAVALASQSRDWISARRTLRRVLPAAIHLGPIQDQLALLAAL